MREIASRAERNQKVMSARQQCPCRECSQSCHVCLKTDQAQTVGRIKLLEQAHCAFCWRPLQVTSEWPGPRTRLLPSDCSHDLSVAQCGHVFHSACLHKQTHCRQCNVFIRDVSPLHVVVAATESAPSGGESLERRLNSIEKELATMRLDKR